MSHETRPLTIGQEWQVQQRRRLLDGAGGGPIVKDPRRAAPDDEIGTDAANMWPALPTALTAPTELLALAAALAAPLRVPSAYRSATASTRRGTDSAEYGSLLDSSRRRRVRRRRRVTRRGSLKAKVLAVFSAAAVALALAGGAANAAPGPAKIDGCKGGGWKHGPYRNQGECVSHFAKTAQHVPPPPDIDRDGYSNAAEVERNTDPDYFTGEDCWELNQTYGPWSYDRAVNLSRIGVSDFSGMDLRGCGYEAFAFGNFVDVSFEDALLDGNSFAPIWFTNISFRDASLRDTFWSSVDFGSGPGPTNANFEGADFTGSHFTEWGFGPEWGLEGVDFSDTIWGSPPGEQPAFRGSASLTLNGETVDLRGAGGGGLIFLRGDFQNAVFDESTFWGAVACEGFVPDDMTYPSGGPRLCPSLFP